MRRAPPETEGGAAPATSAPVPWRPSSVRDLVASDEVLALVLAWLGPVTNTPGVAGALAWSRLLPGVELLTGIKVTRAGAKLLEADVSLRTMKMERGSSWAHVFGALKVNRGIRVLQLDVREVGLRGAKRRAAAQNVKLLAKALAVNVTLEDLDLRDDHLGGGWRALSAVLATNATLRVLRLNNNSFDLVGGRAIGAALATNTGLRELHMSNTSWDAESAGSAPAIAAALTSNATLRKLNLSGTSVLRYGAGSTFFQAVADNQTLQELSVANADLCSTSGAALADMVRRNSTLQVLDLSVNWLGHYEHSSDSRVRPQVLEALKDNVGLHTLRLAECQLTPGDGQVLAKALDERPSGVLLELNVGWNSLGDDDCGAIVAASLKPGSALRELNLSATGMRAATISELAGVLRANHSLEVLVLSYNGDVVVGAEDRWPKLFAALAVNSGLRTLCLDYCELKADDIKALAAALGANRVLRELVLRGNNLCNACINTLAKGLAANTALRKLDLHSCSLHSGAQGALNSVFLADTRQALRELDVRNNVFLFPTLDLVVQAGRAAGCSVAHDDPPFHTWSSPSG